MTTAQNTTDRAAWDQAAARYTEAAAQARADDQTDEQLDEAIGEQVASVRALIAMRAPDLSALAFKARAVLEEQAMFADERPDDAQSLAMMLDSEMHEALAASVYQDALALSGVTGGLVDVRPNGLDCRAWLGTVEAETASRLIYDRAPDIRAFTFYGGNAPEAKRRFGELTARERSWVTELIPAR